MMFKHSQKGVSLVLTFFIMAIILAAVFGTSTILFKKIGMVKDIKDSMAVFYITNSGIEKTIYFDRKVLPEGICNICAECPSSDCKDCISSGTDCGSNCTDCTISYYTEFDGKKYEIEATVVPINGILETTIKSFGSYKKITRAINLTYTREMDWLTGWSKRVKLTIDTNNIDSDLSDFPILVYLSFSSGRDSDDVTGVFDEIGSNSKKIAVTKSDSTTQLYVEVEKWNYTGDSLTSEAWLWVKASGIDSISSSADTDFYLYYDNYQDDNTTYVSDPNSILAENVWDSNYKLVQHLEETAGTHYDSTSNSCDGTPKYGVIQGATWIDGADNFDGIDDNVYCCTLSPVLTQYTGEAWIKGNTFIGTGDHNTYGFTIMATSSNYAIWLLARNGEVRLHAFTGIPNDVGETTTTPLIVGTWHYIAVTAIKGGEAVIYVDGNEELSFTSGTQGWEGYFTIGDLRDNRKIDFDGIIDEVRLSDVVRSPAWIKASYHSGIDDLLFYGNEETQ